MPSFKDVTEKFKNKYLRQLCIEHHIQEVFYKMQRAFADDQTPLETQPLQKELADLTILLDFHKKHDSSFARLIKRRKNKFVAKLKEEKEGK